MFTTLSSTYIIQNLKELLSEVETQIEHGEIIHMLKIKLCKYFENKINNSFPQIEQELDNNINRLIPIQDEEIKNRIDEVLNQMMEEIKKEIDEYLNNKINS
jgi:predicted metal-dependent hydrolase